MVLKLKLISIVISFCAFAISCLALRNNHAGNIEKYFNIGDSDIPKQNRKELYDIYNDLPEKYKNFYNDKIPKEEIEYAKYAVLLMGKVCNEQVKMSETMAKIVSFFDAYASLKKMKCMPKEAFKGASGYTALNVFDKLVPYIIYRRKHDNRFYAEDFQRLVDKLPSIDNRLKEDYEKRKKCWTIMGLNSPDPIK